MAKPVQSRSRMQWLPWVLVVLVILFFAFMRFRLRDIPLERDEGEYAYAGQLLLQGISPYQLAYNMKLPGTYLAYALLMKIFGESAAGIHLGLLVANAVTTVLIFILERQLFGHLQNDARIKGLTDIAAVCSAAAFAFLSTTPGTQGMAGHANHFVILFAVAGLVLLLRAMESSRPGPLFLAGTMFGFAFLMKQHGFVFGAFAGLWLVGSEVRKRSWPDLLKRAGLFSAGVVLPFAITCLWLWRAGVFQKFWFWTFSYASKYAAHEGANVWMNFRDGAVISIPPNELFWLVSGLGLVLMWLDKSLRRPAVFLSVLLAFSAVGFSAGFYFRQHYFILLLPVAAWLIGAAIFWLSKVIAAKQAVFNYGAAIAFGALLFSGIYQHGGLFFQSNALEASRVINSENPFVESLEVARYIRENSTPDAKVAVLGSEPQIYFYARRHSATGYIYTYPLMENQPFAAQMQREMIREIEEAKPEFLVFVGFTFSWLMRSGSDRALFNWFEEFSAQGYQRIGIVDYPSDTGPEYRWDASALGQSARGSRYIYVFRR